MNNKLRFTFVNVTFFGFLGLANAQCPQICDDGTGSVYLGGGTADNGAYFDTAVGYEALQSDVAGSNAAVGNIALKSNTTGIYNIAIGNALAYNTTGQNNVAVGANALLVSNGSDNTATGYAALFRNTTGARNVAAGANALYSNQTGIDNTATGFNALYSGNGSYNTAHGYEALENNTSGNNNTAFGLNALNKNTTGINNAANGAFALYSDTNTAEGGFALYANTTGSFNVSSGWKTLYNNTVGSDNIAIGNVAGFNLTNGSDNIEIGNEGAATDSGVIRLGNQGTQVATYIAGISGVVVAGAQPVAVNASGQLGVKASSARFKEAIRPMDEASEAILALHPVSFRYKKEFDPKRAPQFGLLAEEVAKVSPDLVVTDEQGKPFSVRYNEVNAMLLNEFLKEHRTVQELRSTAVKHEAIIAKQQKQIEALTAGLQKVSAQLEVTRSAPQVVIDNH